MTFGGTGNKSVPPRPPEKGSFPLDHDAECKIAMQRYMKCVQTNKGEPGKCRDETKDYLQCRMDRSVFYGFSHINFNCRGLMAPEEWKNLGFGEEQNNPVVVENQQKKEASGFVAGTGIKQKRE